MSTSRLHLGSAYYPEHWPEKRWPQDIRLMREAGFTVARMAEFAWSSLESAPGEFDFEWLERAISALADAGLVSVLGTPTAAPPAWLVEQYPDLLAVDERGRRVQFGNRCHYCVNSPDFHAATRRLVSAMAQRFAANPRVIGWQLDNEYHRVCYCARCRELLQRYLADKFGSLEALNRHWSTSYWSQTYSAWEQIPLPIGPHNPGLRLEFKHFITESYRRFQQIQLDALRPHLPPDVWVTHNFIGGLDNMDYYALGEDLDLVSWDWYTGERHNDYLTSGARHDLMRGLKRKNFWLMETQPGNVNWATVNAVLNKGEARAMAWHAIAHGADAVLYWQWRSALGGQEQYHGSLVDQSGQPRPFYTEAQQLGQDLAAVSPLLQGSTVAPAKTALLHSFNSRWSLQWQPHHQDFSYDAHLFHYYRPLAANNIPADVISADAPLDGYRLLIAPALVMVGEELVERLDAFVRHGGYLVVTARCGMKDQYNALLPSRQPGPLTALTGVEVEEYYALPEPVPVTGKLLDGVSRLWAERLKVLDETNTYPVAHYGPCNGWLDEQLAITVHSHGKGMVYYVGAYLDEDSQKTLLSHIAQLALARPLMQAPAGVEVRQRITSNKRQVFIVINHQRQEQQLTLPWPAQEHLSGQTLTGELTLAPYGVAVLTRST